MKEGKICRQCSSQFTGPSDKRFCSDQCPTMVHHVRYFTHLYRTRLGNTYNLCYETATSFPITTKSLSSSSNPIWTAKTDKNPSAPATTPAAPCTEPLMAGVKAAFRNKGSIKRMNAERIK